MMKKTRPETMACGSRKKTVLVDLSNALFLDAMENL